MKFNKKITLIEIFNNFLFFTMFFEILFKQMAQHTKGFQFENSHYLAFFLTSSHSRLETDFLFFIILNHSHSITHQNEKKINKLKSYHKFTFTHKYIHST